MKVAWADLKNHNKFSIIEKRKPEDGAAVTVKLACFRDIAAAEYSQSFSESDWSTYDER